MACGYGELFHDASIPIGNWSPSGVDAVATETEARDL
jgi:hypothetical protein